MTDSVADQNPVRSVALDVFRGITVLVMLLVNNIALDEATPDQLTHAEWAKGIHIADLVFPWFLLCVGLSIPFSRASAIRKKHDSRAVFLRVTRRVVTLFFLGCVIVSLIHKQVWISMDVLQLIALSFGAGYALSGLRIDRQIVVVILLMFGYATFLKHVPFPGQPHRFDPDHNAVTAFNRAFLSPWKFDGLLSVIPATCLVVGGSLVQTLRLDKKSMALTGCALIVVGWNWAFDLTFSKAFWTPSYILVCGGLGLVLLAALKTIENQKSFIRTAPIFQVFGANPLAAYIVPIIIKLSILTWIVVPYGKDRLSLIDLSQRLCFDGFGRYWGGWIYTITYITIVWLAARWLGNKGKFVRA